MADKNVISFDSAYRPASLLLLLKQGTAAQKAGVLSAWCISLIASIALGLATVVFDWSGLLFNFGGVDVYITIYLPMIICLLWVLLFGYWWGAIPAYITTLTLALYSDMPLAWALLFACANPLGFAVYAVVYRAIPIPLDFRSSSSVLFFILIAFFSSVLASTGALIWTHTTALDAYQVFAIWQGWWLGGFLQKVFLIGPLLFLLLPVIIRWRRGLSWIVAHPPVRKGNAMTFGGIIVGTVFLFLVFTFNLTEQLYFLAEESQDYEAMRNAFSISLQSVYAVYWIMVIAFLVVVVLGYQFYSYWITTLERSKKAAERQARTDYLTGLNNRRAFYEYAKVIDQQARRYQHNYCIAILDIDYFKAVNDQWGHDVGDQALKAIAKLISDSVREADISARFGGEEFIVMLPETSLIEGAEFADRLRLKIAKTAMGCHEKSIQLTVSIGLSGFSGQIDSLDRLINRADTALYRAKNRGRNAVEITQLESNNSES